MSTSSLSAFEAVFSRVKHLLTPAITAVFLTSTACLIFSPAFASSGTSGAAFLNIPVGAEPAAMGSAYTAMAMDAYAPIWNPAGLGFLEGPEVAGMHLSYLESLNYEFASFAMPVRQGNSIGTSVQYFGANNFKGMDRGGNPTGDFQSYYAAYSLAYGHKMRSRPLALGATVKLIQAKLADVSAHAYGFDLGSLYRLNSKLDLAATLTNMGTPLKFISEGDSLPLTGRAGVAFHPVRYIDLSFDGVYERTGQASARTGVAWHPWQGIALRAGYRTDTLKGLSALAGLSAGMGISIFGQDFAYAWLPYGDLGNTQYFSLLLRFGDALENRKNYVSALHMVRRPKHSASREYQPYEPTTYDKVTDESLTQLLEYGSQRDAAVVKSKPETVK